LHKIISKCMYQKTYIIKYCISQVMWLLGIYHIKIIWPARVETKCPATLPPSTETFLRRFTNPSRRSGPNELRPGILLWLLITMSTPREEVQWFSSGRPERKGKWYQYIQNFVAGRPGRWLWGREFRQTLNLNADGNVSPGKSGDTSSSVPFFFQIIGFKLAYDVECLWLP
jgi:hypothetical protein